ncbi:unnamed protein product [Mycena citricolor]|uniref:Glycolipid transfer protein domain-containing protein n=1 Tax=Mycena citricolor TaxID=2018698 RepID=A0AAD2HZZ5_9AGAR|nr:unnamed protein product [Mycena citricolor]CAK5284948.1 unnamed protein product [Mycena citricolor]
MAPHFETVKSFADVELKNGSDEVDTEGFLLASDGLVALFDLLGAGVFSFVQIDLRNNIAGVRQRYESHASNSTSLEDLVRNEHAEGQKHAAACLTRLIRGLAFTCLALQTTQSEPSCALHVCFRRAYDVVLKHHHTFLVRSVVTIAIRAVPRRDQFYAALCQGGDRENFEQELRRWLDGLEGIVKRTKLFLEDGGYGRV